MSQALYFPDQDLGLKSRLAVVRTNKDGTVDLADGSETVVVTSCPVSTSPKVGHAVLVESPKKEPAEVNKGKGKDEK